MTPPPEGGVTAGCCALAIRRASVRQRVGTTRQDHAVSVSCRNFGPDRVPRSVARHHGLVGLVHVELGDSCPINGSCSSIRSSWISSCRRTDRNSRSRRLSSFRWAGGSGIPSEMPYRMESTLMAPGATGEPDSIAPDPVVHGHLKAPFPGHPAVHLYGLSVRDRHERRCISRFSEGTPDRQEFRTSGFVGCEFSGSYMTNHF